MENPPQQWTAAINLERAAEILQQNITDPSPSLSPSVIPVEELEMYNEFIENVPQHSIPLRKRKDREDGETSQKKNVKRKLFSHKS